MFRIGIKEGVVFKDITQFHIAVFSALEELWNDTYGPCTVTSAYDGTHMVGSFHYTGRALDIRTRDKSPEVAKEIFGKLKTQLGGFYDVVWEGDSASPHIHVEYSPRVPDSWMRDDAKKVYS